MFRLKPDYEQTRHRIEAFWEREIVDRPVVQFPLAKPKEEHVPVPPSAHESLRDRWLDPAYQAQSVLASLSNQLYLGDTLPVAMPNLGPEVFSTFYGCPLHFGETTAWTDPVLQSWDQMDGVQLDTKSPYLAKLHELTDAFLEAGRGVFITGMTDWHPGGDWLAALRDPSNLAMDLITDPDRVLQMLSRGEADYALIYEVFFRKLRDAGQPISTWLPLISDERYYVPSNDFSCMISPAMFERFVMPDLVACCDHLENGFYHLDGSGQIPHLDMLLSIERLRGIQWVPGDGAPPPDQWLDLLKRIIDGGKLCQVFVTAEGARRIVRNIGGKGFLLAVSTEMTAEEAGAFLRQLAQEDVSH